MTTNNMNVSTQHRRDEPAERDWAANDPAGFQKLKPEEQAALVDWIRAVLVPAKTVFRRNSYGMKHDFDREPDGFYVYNGAFKGAMLAAGLRPVDENDLNWRFRVKPAHKLARWEQRQRRVYGRGWLVRNRWREKGYEVIEGAQWLRAQEHSRVCWRERRPRVVVLRAKYLAQVVLDTEPAGHRLTREAVAAVLGGLRRIRSEGPTLIRHQRATGGDPARAGVARRGSGVDVAEDRAGLCGCCIERSICLYLRFRKERRTGTL